jgi:hypothetical protein
VTNIYFAGNVSISCTTNFIPMIGGKWDYGLICDLLYLPRDGNGTGMGK